MNLNELQSIILKSASNIMKKEGKDFYDDGCVTYIKGKRIETIYHIYGKVNDKNRTNKLNTHIKFNLKKKRLEGVNCSCDLFKEAVLNGYTIMCSHIIATSYKFNSALTKDNNFIAEKKSRKTGRVKLVRKIDKNSIYYEVKKDLTSEKIIIKPNQLKIFLQGIEDKTIKFKYEYIELIARIMHKDLPLTFNLKEDNESIVLTTQKKLPINLNSNNDVYFFKNDLYLPSKRQINIYLKLYEKLKTYGQIVYKKDIDNCINLISILSDISESINVSVGLRNFIANSIESEFIISEENGEIFCDAFISYGGKRINILDENKHRLVRDFNKEQKFLMEIQKYNFIKSNNRFVFTGEDTEFFNMLINKDNSFRALGKVVLDNEIRFGSSIRKLDEIEKKLARINNRDIRLPSNFKGTLRSYQLNGFKWIKILSEVGFGGILADEMGLGKTIQTIAFILSEPNKKTFIVCPTSLIYNWNNELKKFAPSLKVLILHGSERNDIMDKIKEYDVILTTYGTLRLNIENYKEIVFDYCFIDEAQNIKNESAQNTKAIKQINANTKFALTGTPIENRLTELWSIFDFVIPGYLYSKEKFEELFIQKSVDNLNGLKQLIKPFILRRTKKGVITELPDKIEKKYIVEMTEVQKNIYSSYLKQVKDMMKNVDGKIEIFSCLTKLRQICLDPSLIVEDYVGGSAKLEVAMEIIKEHIETNGKILLFSQFTSVLHKIGERLNSENINFFHLDGRTRPKDRIEMVDKFNNNEAGKVFLISLKAGGTGLNLTSANLVIHFDPWWNPAVENQATDRAHRIGQTDVVEVIKLVAKGTIEEKIILLQEDKKELIDNVLTGDLQNSSLLSNLSKEDLIQLFERD